MTSRLTQSLATFLLIASLTACGGDDAGAAAVAGSAAGEGGSGGDAGQAGVGGDGGQGGAGGVGGSGGQGGTGGQAGVGGSDEDAGVAGDGGMGGDGGVGGESATDGGVDASLPVECDVDTQDNDGDGVCSAACTDSICGNGTCDDSSGQATCTCDEGWGGETCDVCALGYRDAVVLIGSPAACELDTPATTNMRMWLDADDNSSFTFFSGRVIEWRSRAPGGVGELVDNDDANTRPSRVRATDSTRRVVRFDGVDDRLQGVLDLRSPSYSIFVVAQAAASKAGDQFFIHGLGETNVNRNMRFLARTNATSLRYRHNVPGGIDEVNLTPADTTVPSLIEAHRAGTLIGHALTVQHGADSESIVTEFEAFDERLNVFFGRQGGDSLLGALEGDIAEVIVFVPAIPAASRQAIRDYLNAKWDL